jgi:hypothetical protein
MLELGTGENIQMFEVQVVDHFENEIAASKLSFQSSTFKHFIMQAVPWMETSVPSLTLMCRFKMTQVLYGGRLLSGMSFASSL